MKTKVMLDSKYTYEGKTASEIYELERNELESLRSKPFQDLSFEEMGRLRRLLFRKDLENESSKDHVDVIFNSIKFPIKPSTFTEAYYFSDKKKFDTDNINFDHHYRKNFLLFFNVEKAKNKQILRK